MQTPTNTAPPPTTPRQRNSWGHFIPRSGSVTSQPAASATAGPRSLEAAPPVLSLFRHGAIAVLRIHDLAFSGVVSAVVQSLPADVESLMLVTPTDTKMFAVNAAGGGQHANVTTHRPDRIQSSATEEMEAEAGEDPQAEATRIAAEAEAELDAHSTDLVEEASVQVNMADTPAARRKAMNNLRRAEAGQASDPCGRCGGSGTMQVALPDGGVSQAPCPVCRGSGVIRRFGARH